jgi:hypothetical protein
MLMEAMLLYAIGGLISDWKEDLGCEYVVLIAIQDEILARVSVRRRYELLIEGSKMFGCSSRAHSVMHWGAVSKIRHRI